MHDYDPNWDYLVCELNDVDSLDDATRAGVQRIIDDVSEKLLPQMGFEKMQVFFVEPGGFGVNENSTSPVAIYCNGTSSEPVIGLDLYAILDICKEMDEPIFRHVEVSIVHELGHAYQEAMGAEDHDDFEEDDAEEFARHWVDFREVDLTILQSNLPTHAVGMVPR